jgi:hypothetical protein
MAEIRIRTECTNGAMLDVYVICSEKEAENEFAICAIAVSEDILNEASYQHLTIENLILPDSYEGCKITSLDSWFSYKKVKRTQNFTKNRYCEAVGGFLIPVERLYIPDSITEIANNALSGKKISTVRWPSDCPVIREETFSSSGITTVTNLNNVKAIEAAAFSFCSDLKEFTWPESCDSIPPACFYGCYNLEKINITGSLDSVGEYAFTKTGLICLDLSCSISCKVDPSIIADGIEVKYPFYQRV